MQQTIAIPRQIGLPMIARANNDIDAPAMGVEPTIVFGEDTLVKAVFSGLHQWSYPRRMRSQPFGSTKARVRRARFNMSGRRYVESVIQTSTTVFVVPPTTARHGNLPSSMLLPGSVWSGSDRTIATNRAEKVTRNSAARTWRLTFCLNLTLTPAKHSTRQILKSLGNNTDL